MFTRKNHKIIYIVVLTTVLLLALTSIAMAAVWTDQADYSPGSVVAISGGNDENGTPGYIPGNAVHVDIIGPNEYTSACDTTVGEIGTLSCQIFLWDSDLAVGEYTYIATSLVGEAQPAISETGTFTDASNTENVVFATSGLPTGTSVSISYDGKNPGGNSQSGTVGFAAPGPSGATGFQGSSTINCTFPTPITIGSDIYDLSSQPCGATGTTLPAASSPTHTTTFTGSYTKRVSSDNTPPTSVITLSPVSPNGSNGWYTVNVHVTVTASDNEGGTGVAETRCVIDPVSAPASFDDLPAGCDYLDDGADVTTDGEHTVYAASKDVAGNEDFVSKSFKIDETAPTITATLDKSPAASGWFNISTGAPTVSFTCSDATSGLAGTCPADYTFPEGENQSYSKTIYDNAGNSASADVDNIDVDLTAPNITITTPVDSGSYGLNEPVASVYSCTDSTSGVASCSGTVANGANIDTSSVGPKDFTVTATDNAGNTNSHTHTYYVNYVFSGFFEPVNNPDTVNSAKAGQAIPIKWRLTDFYGIPVEIMSNWGVGVSLTGGCSNGTVDTIETYAGSSGWQYLGDGYWQFNWKTPKTYAGLCLTMTLDLKDGNLTHIAYFKFK